MCFKEGEGGGAWDYLGVSSSVKLHIKVFRTSHHIIL